MVVSKIYPAEKDNSPVGPLLQKGQYRFCPGRDSQRSNCGWWNIPTSILE